MQLSERNPVIIGLVAVGLLLLFAVAALTLQRADFTGGYSLVAEFEAANGLREGDQVSVAGVPVGRVSSLEIVDDHVEALLRIDGEELPADTVAVIAPQTLVGKRDVELEAGGDYSQLLVDGDRIPLERTQVEVDVPEFADASEELLGEIDAEVLNTFLGSLTTLTEGQRDEVAQLVQGGTRLTEVVQRQDERIREVLVQLQGVGETFNGRDDELIRIIDDFQVSLSALNDRRTEISRLFDETTETSRVTADLIAATRGDLDAVLDELHADTEKVTRHQLELAEALAYAPDSVGGFSSIAFAGQERVPFGHVFVSSLGVLGIDVLVGCGGLVDQQLDLILGPDPRSCEEQEVDTFPEDSGGSSEQPQGVGADPPQPGEGTPDDQGGSTAPAREVRLGVDVLGRLLLAQPGASAPDGGDG